MKTLKSLSAFLLISFLSFNTSFAQADAPEMSQEQQAEMKKNMEEFVKVLGLSEDQKPEFGAITKKYAKQMVALRDSEASKMQKYKKLQSISKNRNAEMKEILSKEQYDAYVEKQKEMQKKMREKRG